MAWAIVGSATTVFASITTPQDITVTATTIGNTLVCWVQCDSDRTITSVAGGAGGNYTAVHTEGPAGNHRSGIFAAVCTSSVTTVTVTLSGSATGGANRITFAEFSGGAAVLAEEGTSTGQTNAGGVTTHSAATVTPSGSEVLYLASVGLSGTAGTWTEDGNFTAAVATAGSLEYIAYRIQTGSSAAQSFTAGTTNSRISTVILAALAGATGGAAATVVSIEPAILRPFNMALGRR